MRYQQTREQTAELLRMILPLMSRHAAGYHPLSYALWFEYCASADSTLRAAVDAATADGKLLTDADVEALYDKHIALRDIESSQNLRNRLQSVMEEVGAAAAEANQDITGYSTQLSSIGTELAANEDVAAVSSAIGRLQAETGKARQAAGAFKQKLDARTLEVRQLREELIAAHGLALIDPLTRLLNRRGFEQHVKEAGDGRLARCCALLIDIDHFKAINDTHGHLIGDRVIAYVAEAIRQGVGDKGRAARMGGEEFAVLLTEVNASGAAEIAERIRITVEKGRIRRPDRGEPVGGVTVSVGLAVRQENEKLSALLERGDRALYKSKQDGRNRVTISTRGDN